jgi:MFS family permease
VSNRKVAAALGTTLLTQTLGSATVLAPTVLAPLIASSMGLSVTFIGVYISLVYIAAIVASVLSGPVIDALGGTRVSQISLLACALGLCLVSSSLLVVAALGALIIGLGYGPLTPASSDVLIRAAPPRRMAFIYSLKQTGVPLGGVLAGLLLPVLALTIGWNWALITVGVGCGICALVAIPFRSALDGDRSGKVRRPSVYQILEPVRLTFRSASLRTLAISSCVFSATQFCLAVYLVTFLIEGLHWQIVAAGVALSASQAAGAFGRVLWGWAADTNIGSKRTLIFLASAMAASALSILVLDQSTPSLVVVILMALFGATAAGWNGVFLAAIAKLAPPGQTAFVTGGTLAFTYLGIVIGPLLFGAVADWTGSFSTAFGTLAIPLSLCAVFLLWLKDDREIVPPRVLQP